MDRFGFISSNMKILLCPYYSIDYGSDVLFEGLVETLGIDNVLEYPEKSSFHGDTKKAYRYYPCLYDYPVVKTEAEKIEMLKNNEFDIILVCCRDINDFRGREPEKYSEFYELLKEKSKTIPTYVVDYGDSPDFNQNTINDMNCRAYFKREYLKSRDYGSLFIPLNFAYSKKLIPEDINVKRDNTIFWAGRGVNIKCRDRKEYIKFYEEFKGVPSYSSWHQNRYRYHMLHHTIGLNLKGAGDDTVRYYEVPAHGTLLLSQKLDIFIENDFKNGETAVFFDDIEGLKEKLNYCIDNPDYTRKIAVAGYQWLKQYHTSEVRAKQLLNKIYESLDSDIRL